jgi:hypothetical protein
VNFDEILRLPNKNHSIKECTVSLFLQNPLNGLDTFMDFYKNNLSFIFNEIEPLEHFEVNIDPKTKKIDHKHSNISGFRASRVEGNKPNLILQIFNDKQRQYISIHNLEYSRWANFKNEFSKIFKIIDKWMNNKVIAFNLNYIDEFTLIAEDNSLSKVFDSNSDYLPKGFFKSNNTNLIFNTEKSLKNNKYRHFDRIEIKISNKKIILSHNTIVPIGEHNSFSEFVECSSCSEKIDWAHELNKSLLKEIFTVELQELIQLK